MDTPINAPLRKLPIGIQSFEKLRSENFLYVDKTALIYRLAQAGNPCFLSRPRRFGKSLLLSSSRRTFKVRRNSSADWLSRNWKRVATISRAASQPQCGEV